MTGDPARRAALDHVLALVAAAPCADELVLRGSMAMLAWAPGQAREPGDLDFVVTPSAVVADEPAYPYLDRLDPVQTWAEAVHGAARNEMWTFEEFDTGGRRPRLPPEGLRWLRPEEAEPTSRPHRLVTDLARADPVAAGGVTLLPDAATQDTAWGYAYDAVDGARLHLPWRAADGRTGSVQLDFAYDEPLPDPPCAAAVPRQDGGPPSAVWAASPRLSLLWKLQWLCTDLHADGAGRGKDLVDAVLLAERDDGRLAGRLAAELRHRLPEPGLLRPDSVCGWRVDWSAGPDRARAGWRERLAVALGGMPELLTRLG
ncbi:nucleotidyl transferase AbiEii/AbiGii toxin family protein [Micromonospora sp. MA102]|uniref:nucleotidyl transferase AbiEii/AbiGii toxin family protein n=1 Tax=Micromonospora sp. MA102 TaxID=2952755 RepID=UPI0021C8F22B|nr:nucleotidyl transferase AbiEii/AbiGii toxin family protein [Micromonospora sp. MA102]